MIKKLKRSLYKTFTKIGIIPPKVILVLDGGVCSQMHQYLIGQLFVERGFHVFYDLSFYEEYGTDLNLEFVRNFDLLKAFPYLEFKVASKMTINVYKRKFYHVGNNTEKRVEDFSFLQFTPPIYLGGYYHLPPDIWLGAFRRIFKMDTNVLDKHNQELCDEIKEKDCSVAVHVRRGDLKVEVYSYGKPAPLSYFEKAVSFFKEKEREPFFYFFSDEPEWVAKELVPNLQMNENYKIVDINGSDKGYMDLYLIAHCKHQITSKGTLGKYGALLMDNPQKQVVLCNDATEYYWKELLQNPIFM